MSSISLRDYQQLGIDRVYDGFRNGGKRVIYWLQTGGGKSVVFSKMIEDAVKHDMHVVLCVRRRTLIKQASNHLDKWGIPHGVYMANHYRFQPKQKVQICSIDTLSAREIYPHEDKENTMVIIDESHDCTPRGKKYSRLVDRYSNKYIVGFTATPFSDNSLFEGIVNPISAHELRDSGYLVPDRTFVPNIVDVSDVKRKRNGDYNEQELFEACSKSEVVGSFVDDWKKYSGGRPTILFAVNVEHSKIICEEFQRQGIRAEHHDAKSSDKQRSSAVERLGRGELSILSNVDIFSTGLDAPFVSCIQLCRPTQSIIWHLQAIGRGLRPDKGSEKQNCVVIDNAGNTLRHGSVYKVREAYIGKSSKKKSDEDLEDISIRACKRCSYIFEATQKICPDCKYINPPVERKINHIDGELVEYNMTPEEIKIMKRASMIADFHKLSFVSKKRGLATMWIYHTINKKYDKELLLEYGSEINFPLELLT